MPFTLNRSEAELVHLSGDVAPQSVTPAADRERIGSLLVRFYEYLKANGPQHPQLGVAIDQMQSAVAAYRADSAADPWAPLLSVNGAIAQARALDPTIPEP